MEAVDRWLSAFPNFNVGHVSNVPTTQWHVGNVPHNMRAPRAHHHNQRLQRLRSV